MRALILLPLFLLSACANEVYWYNKSHTSLATAGVGPCWIVTNPEGCSGYAPAHRQEEMAKK